LQAPAVEPLHAELEAFLDSVRTRREPRTSGEAGRAALDLASRVMASIQEHADRVQVTGGQTTAGIAAFAAQEKTHR